MQATQYLPVYVLTLETFTSKQPLSRMRHGNSFHQFDVT